MKTLLLLLLTCLPLWAATTYTVLSDNTNRTIAGGTTNLSLLNANQTFTGTNTFAPAKFFPANEIAIRRLWTSPTNIFLSSIAVSAGSAFTNNGDFANCTYIAQATLPALMGSNSHVLLTFTVLRTNANATAGQLVVFAGSNTNYVGVNNSLFSATAGRTTAINIGTLHNANSFTEQFGGASFQSQLVLGPVSLTDTSAPFTLYLGAQTATSFTNLSFYGLSLYELYAP